MKKGKTNAKPHRAAQKTEPVTTAPGPANSPVIVAFGASAGGLDAFKSVLQQVPVNAGFAMVLVQHLDPQHDSILTSLLARATALNVTEVTAEVRVEPNCVYVIPPNKDLTITHGVLHLEPRQQGTPHLPIDRFFTSLAEDQGSKAIAVVLSGTASDGSQGIKAIKAAGGIVFAQTPGTAQYNGMPTSAIATGCVDFVLPPEGIARELVRLGQHPYLRQDPEPDMEGTEERDERAMREIFGLVCNASGVDFSLYKRGTIVRRTLRRMALLKMESLDHYAGYLRQHPDEMTALFQDILINVTAFFREPATFDLLKQRVFPALFKDRTPGDAVRVWVPGCATGEDTYSIAICLFEYMREVGLGERVQIFGTDLSDTALEKARAGIYSESIAADVSAERLRRFFVRINSSYQIARSVRDTCVFARQNITKDPPFSKLDLILCRNVMIYLGASLQNTAIRLFHYALRPHGYLVLGLSESVGAATELFAPVDKRLKIYHKRPGAFQLSVDIGAYQDRSPAEPAREPAPHVQTGTTRSRIDQLLLSRYSPPALLLDRAMRVQEFRGHTGLFLEHASGEANLDLAKMTSNTVLMEVQRLVRRAQAKNGSVKGSTTMVLKDRTRNIQLTVVPVHMDTAGEPQFLVIFEDADPVEPAPEKRKSAPSTVPQSRLTERIKDLEQELAATREYLQTVIEEQEASTEELKSAHEEVQSGNEELQSTNEELLTAKEELQSTNEELTTVNEEMQSRNAELQQVNNDLINLLSSVNIPTVMLGSDLRIRRFTPQAEKLFNLLATDVGRPISDLRPQINIPDVVGLCNEVLDDLTPREREVQDSDGRAYSMWIRPYRTAENRIDGVVLALFDISERKHSAEARYRRLFEAATDGILIADAASGVIVDANPYLVKLSGIPRQKLLGTKFWESPLFPSGAMDPSILTQLQETESIRKTVSISGAIGEPLQTDIVCNTYTEGERRVVQFNIRDIGGNRQLDAQAYLQEEQLRHAQKMEAVGRLASGVAHDFNNLLTVLLGDCDLLEEQLKSTAVDPRPLQQIRSAGERASAITKQLLAFGRRRTPEVSLLDLNDVVAEMEKLIEVMLPSEIALDLKAQGPPLLVNADRGEIEQVVLNLVLNARDAMPRGGRISVRTGATVASGAPAAGSPALPAGEYVSLVVQDTGTGMDAETQARMFEPFFSTKPKGEGAGLGLATVYGIVQQSGGFISVSSTLGAGATFSVFLPRATGESLAELPPGGDLRGAETILIVDDEPQVRDVMTRYLRSQGYQVFAAPNGPEGIRLAKQHDGEIAAMVVDVVMPGMSGREVAYQLAPLRPNMKVLYTSGHAEDAISHHGVLEPGIPFLRKPFKLRDLGARLRTLLDR